MLDSSLSPDLFQFHIGSIQRRDRHRTCRRKIGFNSTLVRFKVASMPQHRQILEQRFNSTLVRFKAQTQTCIDASPVQVSIPHWFDSKRMQIIGSCCSIQVSIPHWFDSKIARCSRELTRLDGFNSTLVRFKGHPSAIRAASIRFNSTLVRFKVS